jgi:hypothetical protein
MTRGSESNNCRILDVCDEFVSFFTHAESGYCGRKHALVSSACGGSVFLGTCANSQIPAEIGAVNASLREFNMGCPRPTLATQPPSLAVMAQPSRQHPCDHLSCQVNIRRVHAVAALVNCASIVYHGIHHSNCLVYHAVVMCLSESVKYSTWIDLHFVMMSYPFMRWKRHSHAVERASSRLLARSGLLRKVSGNRISGKRPLSADGRISRWGDAEKERERLQATNKTRHRHERMRQWSS